MITGRRFALAEMRGRRSLSIGRQFLMFWFLLLGACAGLSSGLKADAQAGTEVGQPIIAAATPASVPPKFFCNVWARSDVSYTATAHRLMEDIWIPGPGERLVALGAFRFHVRYSNDRYESPSFSTQVYSASTGKLIEQTLFQFDRNNAPVDLFERGGDFTGLREVHDPNSAAELVYWCRSV